MKNKLLKILTLILALSFSFAFITACDNSGGGDTPPEHQCEYGEWISNGNSTHTRVCKTNGEHKQTENCSGGTATCTEKAICSICEQKYGGLKAHDHSTLKFDETTHWYECVCGDKVLIENHYGGTATCTKKADCSLCEQEYGVKAHVFDKEIATEKYFVSEITCQHGTQYNYSCECGEKGSETFEVGEKVDHEYVLDKCKWCEKEKVTSKGLSFTLINNDTEYKVSRIGTCTDIDIVIPSIYMGKIVTTIGSSAFSNCTSLKTIEIPNSVTSIGDWAFNCCISLETIEIPNSVTSIGDDAFCDCHSLKSIEIPNSVTSIGIYAFGNCYSLESIEIPSSVTSMGVGAFGNCYSLTSIEIPNSVTSIGDDAFCDCHSLISVTFEENSKLTSIGNYAFYYCESLESIEIPNSVTSIGNYAFRGCDSLESITFNGTTSEWDSISKGEDWNYFCPVTEVICTDGTVTIN